jgi:ubiquinone/menaquinone biosynthesis C-methylase UbiE
VSSISFDRAAPYYDATRGLPERAQEALTAVLAHELAGRGPALEVGVGTGRIGLPLHQRGLQLVGADISAAMMARMVEKAGGAMPFPLLQADATAMPFGPACFGAVLFSHVLHLVAEWRTALDESLRALVPGGAVLVDFGGPWPTPWSSALEQALHRHGVRHERPGVSEPGEVAGYLAGRAEARRLPPVPLSYDKSLGQELAQMEAQEFSWTWPYSRGTMAAATAEMRAWAAREGWPLERPAQVSGHLQWWAYDRLG